MPYVDQRCCHFLAQRQLLKDLFGPILPGVNLVGVAQQLNQVFDRHGRCGMLLA
jgi:hypothetical protein